MEYYWTSESSKVGGVVDYKGYHLMHSWGLSGYEMVGKIAYRRIWGVYKAENAFGTVKNFKTLTAAKRFVESSIGIKLTRSSSKKQANEFGLDLNLE